MGADANDDSDFNTLVQAKFRPYVIAVGTVAHAWNQLQETLGRLFAELLGSQESQSLAVWYSLKSDRLQHDMLLATIRATADDHWPKFPTARDDLKWLVDRVKELARIRNEAIHAPISMIVEDSDLRIVPHYFFGNPLAEDLNKKGVDLLQHLDGCSEWARLLQNFGDDALNAQRYGLAPWPDRPVKPNQKPKNTLQGQRLPPRN